MKLTMELASPPDTHYSVSSGKVMCGIVLHVFEIGSFDYLLPFLKSRLSLDRKTLSLEVD